MSDWLYKNKIEIIIFLITGLFVNIGCYLQMHGFYITFLDTDDYMRLVRIRDFFDHQDLSNNIISRGNAPLGCDLHWTRFYDFFLIIPVYILNFFLNSIDESIKYVGFFISPVVKSVTIIFLFYTIQKIMGKDNAFLAAVLFLANPLVLPFGSFGRPDHHAFIMLFIVVYLYSITTIIESKFSNKNDYIKAALISSLCIWISPETLIPLLLIDAVLFIYTFSYFSVLKNLCLKNMITACCIGVIVFISSAPGVNHIMAVCILLLLTPYTTYNKKYFENLTLKYWHIPALVLMLLLFPMVAPIEYDKISTVHFALYVFSTIFFGINMLHQHKSIKHKILYALGWLLIIAAAFLYTYPKFLYGMSAHISEYVKRIWLYKVAEMQSPFKHGDAIFFVTYAIIAAVSITNKLVELIYKQFSQMDILWWIFVTVSACYTIFAGISYKMLPYAILFSLPLMIDLGMNSVFVNHLHRLFRILITFLITTLFIYFTAYLKNDDTKQNVTANYRKHELYEELDKISYIPVVIMAHSNDGPELLYYTKHCVVGAPYHRQHQGIISSHVVMEQAYKKSLVKEVLLSTNSSYIFIRKSKYAQGKRWNKRASLANMIINNKLPDWISVIKLPTKFNDVIIAKINRELLAKQ